MYRVSHAVLQLPMNIRGGSTRRGSHLAPILTPLGVIFLIVFLSILNAYVCQKTLGNHRPPLNPTRTPLKKQKCAKKQTFLKTVWGELPKPIKNLKWNTFLWYMKLVFQCSLEKKIDPPFLLFFWGVSLGGQTLTTQILYNFLLSSKNG